MTPDYLTLELNLPTLGAIAAAAWFVWMRYQNLEKRLRQMEVELMKEQHALSVSRQATISDRDHIEYLVNANRELIEHRTNRFTTELGRLRDELCQDILEIKQFLDKTTEFRMRTRAD